MGIDATEMVRDVMTSMAYFAVFDCGKSGKKFGKDALTEKVKALMKRHKDGVATMEECGKILCFNWVLSPEDKGKVEAVVTDIQKKGGGKAASSASASSSKPSATAAAAKKKKEADDSAYKRSFAMFE